MNEAVNNWSVQVAGMALISAAATAVFWAVAFAGAIMAWLLPGWWLVTVAQGEPDTMLSVLGAVFAFCFITAVIWLARRN
jgi:hypothetical protein